MINRPFTFTCFTSYFWKPLSASNFYPVHFQASKILFFLISMKISFKWSVTWPNFENLLLRPGQWKWNLLCGRLKSCYRCFFSFNHILASAIRKWINCVLTSLPIYIFLLWLLLLNSYSLAISLVLCSSRGLLSFVICI